jgi:hypothetical protein
MDISKRDDGLAIANTITITDISTPDPFVIFSHGKYFMVSLCMGMQNSDNGHVNSNADIHGRR